MDNIDLYEIAESNDTEVEFFDMPNNQSISLMLEDGSTYIGIDQLALESDAEERVHLAHELGHCITGSFYNMYSEFDIRERHERRADIWAIKKLVPKDELLDAFSDGCTELSELAGLFNVTEDFIQKACSYYFY